MYFRLPLIRAAATLNKGKGKETVDGVEAVVAGPGEGKGLGRAKSFSLLHSPVRNLVDLNVPPLSTTPRTSPPPHPPPRLLSAPPPPLSTNEPAATDSSTNSDEEVSLQLVPFPLFYAATEPSRQRNTSGQFSVAHANDLVRLVPTTTSATKKRRISDLGDGEEVPNAVRKIDGADIILGFNPNPKSKQRTSSRQILLPTLDYYARKPASASTVPHFPSSNYPLPSANSVAHAQAFQILPVPRHKKPKAILVKSPAQLAKEAFENHWAFLKVDKGPGLELEWEKGWKEGPLEDYKTEDLGARRKEVLGRILEISLVADDILPPSYPPPPSSFSPPTPKYLNSSTQTIHTLLSITISKFSSSHGQAPTGFSWVTKEESISHGQRGKVVGFTERTLEEGGYGRMWETTDWVKSDRWIERVNGKGKERELIGEEDLL